MAGKAPKREHAPPKRRKSAGGTSKADAVVDVVEMELEQEVEALEEEVASDEQDEQASAGPASRRTGARDDDEADVVYVQHSGDLALVDFPHARQNCAAHPFVAGKEATHCANCFCFVCE